MIYIPVKRKTSTFTLYTPCFHPTWGNHNFIKRFEGQNKLAIKKELGNGVVTQPPKLSVPVLASHIGMPICTPAAPLWIQVPANELRTTAEDDPDTWAPTTLMADSAWSAWCLVLV